MVAILIEATNTLRINHQHIHLLSIFCISNKRRCPHPEPFRTWINRGSYSKTWAVLLLEQHTIQQMALACPVYSCHSHNSNWSFDPGNYTSSLFINLKAISLRIPWYQRYRLRRELSSCAQALVHSQVGVIWRPCSTQKAVRASDAFILENFIMFWDSGCLTSLSLLFLCAWVFAEFKVGDFFQVWLFSTPLLCLLTSRRRARWLLLHYVVFICGMNRWSRTSWCWLIWCWVAILT